MLSVALDRDVPGPVEGVAVRAFYQGVSSVNVLADPPPYVLPKKVIRFAMQLDVDRNRAPPAPAKGKSQRLVRS